MAPLGLPVVPEVNMTWQTSSAVTAAARAARSASSALSARARKSANPMPSPTAPRMTTISPRAEGRPARSSIPA